MHTEHRDQRQRSGEDRQHRVVGQRRREVGALVLGELVDRSCAARRTTSAWSGPTGRPACAGRRGRAWPPRCGARPAPRCCARPALRAPSTWSSPPPQPDDQSQPRHDGRRGTEHLGAGLAVVRGAPLLDVVRPWPWSGPSRRRPWPCVWAFTSSLCPSWSTVCGELLALALDVGLDLLRGLAHERSPFTVAMSSLTPSTALSGAMGVASSTWLLPSQADQRGRGEQHDGDDQGRQPGVHDEREREDRRWR